MTVWFSSSVVEYTCVCMVSERPWVWVPVGQLHWSGSVKDFSRVDDFTLNSTAYFKIFREGGGGN